MPAASEVLRRAEPALVPALVLLGLGQALRDAATVLVEVGWVAVVCLPLLARHRWPAAVSATVSVGLLGYGWVTGAPTPFVASILAFLVAFYSAGAWASLRPALLALAIGLATFWLSDALLHHGPGEYVASALLVAGPWTAGRALRAVRRQNARLQDLADQLEREQEAHARDAVLADRARLAREMHDVLGHSLSVISLHAQAAESALERDPSRLGEPLGAIDEATRVAMRELRSLVAVLDERDGADVRPLPLVGDLPALVEEHRASGLEVSLALGDPPPELPAGIQLTAYRIVQEGLTNVRRHTAARRAYVAVRFEGAAAHVEVVDEGPLRPDPRGASGGRGLLGARARAASCGGSMEAGPHGGGWALRACLPYAGAT